MTEWEQWTLKPVLQAVKCCWCGGCVFVLVYNRVSYAIFLILFLLCVGLYFTHMFHPQLYTEVEREH